jgi:hypothetical protein
MLSTADNGRIKVDLATLEKALDRCSDSGLRKVIEIWIKEAKRKLEGSKKDS